MLDNDCKGYFTYGEYARSRLPVAIPFTRLLTLYFVDSRRST